MARRAANPYRHTTVGLFVAGVIGVVGGYSAHLPSVMVIGAALTLLGGLSLFDDGGDF